MKITPSDREVCKSIDEFKRQVDEEETEVRPNQNSPDQQRIADLLSADMDYYQRKTEEFREKATSLNREKKTASQWLANDNLPSDVLEQLVGELASAMLDELWTDRCKCARAVREHITAARVHGMVHLGEELRKKYNQCLDDNRKLSKQILEYKAKHSLP